jgi:hypothetical protein
MTPVCRTLHCPAEATKQATTTVGSHLPWNPAESVHARAVPGHRRRTRRRVTGTPTTIPATNPQAIPGKIVTRDAPAITSHAPSIKQPATQMIKENAVGWSRSQRDRPRGSSSECDSRVTAPSSCCQSWSRNCPAIHEVCPCGVALRTRQRETAAVIGARTYGASQLPPTTVTEPSARPRSVNDASYGTGSRPFESIRQIPADFAEESEITL